MPAIKASHRYLVLPGSAAQMSRCVEKDGMATIGMVSGRTAWKNDFKKMMNLEHITSERMAAEMEIEID